MKPPGPSFAADLCRFSIVIKALNEEKRIVAAIETALASVQSVGGEVVRATRAWCAACLRSSARRGKP